MLSSQCCKMPWAGQGSPFSCWPCDQPRLCDILQDRLHSHQAPTLQSFPFSPCLVAFQYESSVEWLSPTFPYTAPPVHLKADKESLAKYLFLHPDTKLCQVLRHPDCQLYRYKQHGQIRAVCQMEPYPCQVPNSPWQLPHTSAACPARTTHAQE